MADERNRPTGYDGPVGGWASVREVADILREEGVVFHGARLLTKQNKPDGFACVSCAWAKPAHPHPFEYCQNGAKATAWELTSRRAEPDFFERHTLAELERWSDHELESIGRLTEPMRWDAATDRYLPVPWPQAYLEIGAALRAMDPRSAVFYASGRASLEASYMWQLFARMYGSNNLPDSSNMCHESTSVALPDTIGVPVGTVVLDDFEATDCILFFGQNLGTNSPRMLHQVKAARERDVPVVTFNPLRERGLVEFKSPQSPTQMLGGPATVISTQYHQLRVGGDLGALAGMCKWLIEADDRALRDGGARVLDARSSPSTRTDSRRSPRRCGRSAGTRSERGSGLARAALEAAASEYARAKAVIAVYGDGPHAAPQGRAERADAVEPAAAARQHRSARRRHLPGARPLQRAGPAHRRHHREARARAARPARRASTASSRRAGRASTRSRRARACSTGACGPSWRWAATSCARCRTRRASRRPGGSCRSPCRSPRS
jgi:molybdopterin-dependent oxidoreductase alpha subunit